MEVNNEDNQDNEQVQDNGKFVKLSVLPSLSPKSAVSTTNLKFNFSDGRRNNSSLQGSNLKPNPDEKVKLLTTDKKDPKQNQSKENDKKVKEDEKDKKEENKEEIENLRTQKLMNSRDNSRKTVIIQFALIAALFMIYFVVDFIMEIALLENVKKTYKHLRLIGQRPGIVKNTLLFTLEQVANASVQTQNSLVFTQGTKIDVKAYYSNLLYENEREIFQSMAESYPNSFQDYESLFHNYNYNDLCLNYYKLKENSLTDRKLYLEFFKI